MNTAVARGTPPSGPQITSPPSTATVTATSAPALALLKRSTPPAYSFVGQVLTYSFDLVNTGNRTLTAVSVADTAFSGTGPPPVITCPVTTLDPGQTTTCSGTYVVTQEDIDAGELTDTAIATGTPPTGPPIQSDPYTLIVPDDDLPAVTLVKTADPANVSTAGQTVTYTFLVTNAGNTSLETISVTDTAFSGTGPPPVITCPVVILRPTQSTTCSATYQMTQADIDAGAVVNTAVARAYELNEPDEPVFSEPSTATVTAAPEPALSLVKSASPTTVSVAGQTVSYSLLVTNTGNVTVRTLAAADTAFSGTGTPPVFTCPVTTLVPQGTTTCTGTYRVTQADIDAGTVTDTAVATGTGPAGQGITSNGSTATVTVSAASSLALRKTADPTVMTQAGQAIVYSYLVTNTGDVTLNTLTVTDMTVSRTGPPATGCPITPPGSGVSADCGSVQDGARPVITCPVTTLAPGASTTCTATYRVTQEDIDAGTITNTASAAGIQPGGAVTVSNDSTATVTALELPAVSLVKSVSPTIVTRPGQTVTYSFVVTNTGNVTLHDVGAADIEFWGNGEPPVVSCPVSALSPGQSTTCTATYTVTGCDFLTGTIQNTARAFGVTPSGARVGSRPSSTTLTAAGNGGGGGRWGGGGRCRCADRCR
ncbi:hypothetical protein Sru01_69590 [Sphaerisporangium rufum]|uniref:DUF7507 domain-containing protein n=1 Tax=Sphaerisporangium rufum TaxID=1381558 RepID=A0A919R973_9ACTN|nr:hypothetical protein Sru01_69590 [Sphaerisporangium rufum]